MAAGKFMFKINNNNIRLLYKIGSKLAVKTQMRYQ